MEHHAGNSEAPAVRRPESRYFPSTGRTNLKKTLAKNLPEHLTTGIVARNCGVSKVTVLRWIEKGNLNAFRLPGGQNRILRDDFYAFAAKHKIPVNPPR